MAQTIGTGSEAYRNAPWSKRASMLPRKTYSADSAIVYKRRKHKMTIEDANRIMDKVLAEEAALEGSRKSKTFLEKLLAFIRKLTIRLLKYLLPGLLSWAVQPVYDFLNETGTTLIDSPALDPERQARLRKIWNNFLGELYTALQQAWTVKGDD